MSAPRHHILSKERSRQAVLPDAGGVGSGGGCTLPPELLAAVADFRAAAAHFDRALSRTLRALLLRRPAA